jgi:hypothetical protein
MIELRKHDERCADVQSSSRRLRIRNNVNKTWKRRRRRSCRIGHIPFRKGGFGLLVGLTAIPANLTS